MIVLADCKQPHHTAASMAAWIKFQRELAALSDHTSHCYIEEAGHAIHFDNPNAVVKAIEDMVMKVKKREKGRK